MELRVKKEINQQEEIMVKDLQKMLNKNKTKQFNKEQNKEDSWLIIGLIALPIVSYISIQVCKMMFM